MSLVTENTYVTAVPELDIYAKTPVQTSIESTYTEEIRPIAQLNSGAHYEFLIHNAINEYVKLKDITLYVRFRIKLSRSDTTPLSANDWTKVSTVNNFLHSLWSQIDLSIGDSQTTTSLQTYPYRAYFETILYSTPQSRKSHLASCLFFEDEMTTKKDEPYVARMKYFNTDKAPWDSGKECEMEGKLHMDLFSQHRALIGGTRMKLRLIPNRPEFYFMCSDNNLIPKIHFEDIHLNIKKFRVSEDLLYAQLNALNLAPAKYIINRAEVRSVTIPDGVTSRNIENVINGILPRRIFLAFVPNEAYSGSFKKNPFAFRNCGINSLACFVNGEQVPRRAFTPDFSKGQYLREYLEVYKILEQHDNDARAMLTLNNYDNGYTIFAFNLSRDESQGYASSGYVNIPREGVLRFEIHFSEELKQNVNVLIYCEFDNQISIAEDRNAFMDYR